MLKLIYLALFVAIAWSLHCQHNHDKISLDNGAEFCYREMLKSNGSHRNVFAYHDDCHIYIQCLAWNETSTEAVIRHCQVGTYWRQDKLDCVLEGSETCTPHPCEQPEFAISGKYYLAGMPCNMFFLCGFTSTQCCDVDQRFNRYTGECDYDPSCREECTPQHLFIPEPVRLTPTSCQDIYKNVLTSQANPRKFKNGEFVFECAMGTEFDLETCRCNKIVEVVKPRSGGAAQCQLWLPFDSDTLDHSSMAFTTTSHEGVEIDHEISAHGDGSLRLIDRESFLSIPGLQAVDLNKHNEASWCFFFRCEQGVCGEFGGIFSNNHDELLSDFSFIAAIRHPHLVTTRIGTWSNPGEIDFHIKKDWNQICTVWEVAQVRTYLNANLVLTEHTRGNISISQSPYLIGFDPYYGGFVGHVDEVLFCDHAISRGAIWNHYVGSQESLRRSGLIP